MKDVTIVEGMIRVRMDGNFYVKGNTGDKDYLTSIIVGQIIHPRAIYLDDTARARKILGLEARANS